MVASLFQTVAMMMLYMLIGFLLCKSKRAIVSHAKSFSGLLIYILGPSMIIGSFLKLDFTGDNIARIGKYFAVSLIVQIIFFGLIYACIHKKYEDSRYRILTVGSVLGNVGFMGMPIIASVFPDNPIVLCYSSINVMTMNLIVFTIGAFLITNDKKYVSPKSALLNPTSIAILIALPLFLFEVKVPKAISDSVDLLGSMATPMCTFILGMRLSEASLKKIFTRLFVYITCLLKLVVFPVLAFLMVHWLPFLDESLKTTVVVLAMTPSGAIIESLAEIHECQQELAANVVLLTTILSIITIPLMTMLLV